MLAVDSNGAFTLFCDHELVIDIRLELNRSLNRSRVVDLSNPNLELLHLDLEVAKFLTIGVC